jgi:hypothetical protein
VQNDNLKNNVDHNLGEMDTYVRAELRRRDYPCCRILALRGSLGYVQSTIQISIEGELHD